MADMRGLVGDVLPRVEGDPNTVRTVGGEPVEGKGEADISQRPEWQVAQADAPPFIPSHMWTRMQQKGISPSQIDDALKGKRTLQPNGNTACIGAAVIVILSPSGGYVTCYWK